MEAQGDYDFDADMINYFNPFQATTEDKPKA
jgi:hypothetical protein